MRHLFFVFRLVVCWSVEWTSLLVRDAGQSFPLLSTGNVSPTITRSLRVETSWHASKKNVLFVSRKCFTKMLNRRRFGRRRNKRSQMHRASAPSEKLKAPMCPKHRLKNFRKRLFRSERSIRRRRYVDQKRQRRVRSSRVWLQWKKDNACISASAFIFASKKPRVSNEQRLLNACLPFGRRWLFVVWLILLLFGTGSYARPPPTDEQIRGETFVSFWSSFIFILALFFIVIVATAMVELRRGSRVRTRSVLLEDTIHPDDARSPRNASDSGSKRARRKTEARRTPEQAAAEREIHRRSQAEFNSRIRQRVNTEEEAHAKRMKEKADTSLAEEANLPPSTRDVKHFREAMDAESDMEPCRVRLNLRLRLSRNFKQTNTHIYTFAGVRRRARACVLAL